MEDAYIENSVRTRLILSGINELEEHGIKDFSLRRTALAAQVSCAAPYRHFRDKDELIREIIKYIASKWSLLCHEIRQVFKNDSRRLVIELAVANLRFWIANPNYRSVLITASHVSSESLADFEEPLLSAVDAYLNEKNNGASSEMKKYMLRALIYGSLTLIGSDTERDIIIRNFKKKVEEEFI